MNKIYSVSWGYSMSLNNFYKVIKETPKGAIVRKIDSTILENDGLAGGYETPNPNVELTERDWSDPEGIKVKYKDYKVIKTETGYKGKVGLSRTYWLTETKVGDKHYFNHND